MIILSCIEIFSVRIKQFYSFVIFKIREVPSILCQSSHSNPNIKLSIFWSILYFFYPILHHLIFFVFNFHSVIYPFMFLLIFDPNSLFIFQFRASSSCFVIEIFYLSKSKLTYGGF